jgi:hypothetical protein
MKLYRIAGLLVAMEARGRTALQAIPYEVEKPEKNRDITVRWTTAALERAQPHLSRDDCDYIASGIVFYRELIRFDGFMLHASAIVRDGKAYLFTAPSGGGKSTHTALWQRVFGEEQVTILNDDKPALRYVDGCWYAYGTPWSGREDKSVPMRAPVSAILVMEKSKDNRIEPMDETEALIHFLRETVHPGDEQDMGRLLDLMDSLIRSVSVWRIQCDATEAAVIMADEAIRRAEGSR